MQIDEMKTIPMDLSGDLRLDRAQEEARTAVSESKEDLRLIAWYDRSRETGGPATACKGEVPKCVRDYATSHGAEARVWVNDGAFEFYFATTGKDVEELDRDWALRIHEDTKGSEHANVQGG
ncbi:MAG: AF1514 family protein [Gemmatimonadota bacterium]